MKSIITNQNARNARNYSGEKELVGQYYVVGKINGELKEVVICRCYMGRSRNASTVYASLLVHGDGVHVSGRGSAGGYGYHKESAAIGDAIKSAGIELYGDVYEQSYAWNNAENTPEEIAAIKRRKAKQRAYIGGVGDSAVRDALLAIAKAAGAKGKLLVI